MRRVNEKLYHVTENNCENLVMWCICGSNVSLQATRKRINAVKIVSVLAVPDWLAVESIILPIRISFSSYGIDILELYVPLVFDADLQMSNSHMLLYYEKLEQGVITEGEYIEKASESLVLTPFRAGGRIIGIIISTVCLVLQRKSSIGGLLPFPFGAVGGHLVGMLNVHYNLLGLRTLATLSLLEQFSRNSHPTHVKFVPSNWQFLRFVFTPVAYRASTLAFNLLSFGIKHKLSTEILYTTLSPYEVAGFFYLFFLQRGDFSQGLLP